MEVYIKMVLLYDISQQPMWSILILLIGSIWTVIWKGIGMWHSARNKQKGWFVVILIFNTLGLLPIIYLLWFKPKNQKFVAVQKKLQKKKTTKKK